MELNFKSYTGTKTVKAMPMCANKAKSENANVPEKYFEVGTPSYNPGADGYLVEYEGGYRSWSPKKVFDEAYRLSETKVDRMKIELAGLNVRMKEITEELYNPERAFSSSDDRWALSKQLEAMREYANILFERILYATSPRTVVSSDNKADVIQGQANYTNEAERRDK